MEQVLKHVGEGVSEPVVLEDGVAKILAVVRVNEETTRLALAGGCYVDISKLEMKKQRYEVGGLYTQKPAVVAGAEPGAQEGGVDVPRGPETSLSAVVDVLRGAGMALAYESFPPGTTLKQFFAALDILREEHFAELNARQKQANEVNASVAKGDVVPLGCGGTYQPDSGYAIGTGDSPTPGAPYSSDGAALIGLPAESTNPAVEAQGETLSGDQETGPAAEPEAPAQTGE